MGLDKNLNNGIPVSISLTPTLQKENVTRQQFYHKKRLLLISVYAVLVAIAVSFIAKLLVYLIALFTNISFYGSFSVEEIGPAGNTLGYWVIIVPVIGGLIVGLMALYGSKAIRGHGIPEAMEQILTNQSKIKPAITYLKPLSAAISIGTGGPFGAEGPIIATGGALGSTFGQLLKITSNERKILLAAGATAGMSAIFGSPIAAIFLAIELLLFEFSPRSIIPVALACITGAAGHHLLFESGPVFGFSGSLGEVSNTALLFYSLMGIAIGLLSIGITKIVYLVEDAFEKLPIHWMWWPAIGGLAVGIVGYFSPHTLGVGYTNITHILSGAMSVKVVLSLCILKFVSWAISLGSGTSGGTLAPMLTIGGATGFLLGDLMLDLFPDSGISPQLSALVGMSALFAGASRALLTSIIFALETTNQSGALLPLLTTCSASYFVSFFLMENTIMTEKIARRGVKTPHSYESDILEKISVSEVMDEEGTAFSGDTTIDEVRAWMKKEKDHRYFILSDGEGEYQGVISVSDLMDTRHDPNKKIAALVKQIQNPVQQEASLRTAVETMALEKTEVLPVTDENGNIEGILSYQEILRAYQSVVQEDQKKQPHLSLRRGRKKMIILGHRLIASLKDKK